MDEFFGSIPFLIFVIYIVSSIIGAVGKALQQETGKKREPGKEQKPVQPAPKGPFDRPWWEGPWFGETEDAPFPWGPKKADVKRKPQTAPKKAVGSEAPRQGGVEGRKDVEPSKRPVSSRKAETKEARAKELARDFAKGAGAIVISDSQIMAMQGSEDDMALQEEFDWDVDVSDEYDDWTPQSDWLRSIFMDKGNVVRGIVLSEVLGPPKSMR